MAPPRKKYTRKNPDPNPTKLVDNPEKSPSPPLLKISISLSKEIVQTLEYLLFDLKFEYPFFRSKSDSDLSQVIVDIPALLTFVPKEFYSISKKNK